MVRRSQSKSFLMAGGLGNQLFILAAGSYYMLQNKENVTFDFNRYANGIPPHDSDIRSFCPNANFQYRPYRGVVKTVLNKLSNRSIFPTYTSSGVGYDPALESHILENQIFGFFQTYKYLGHPRVRNLIDSLFFRFS